MQFCRHPRGWKPHHLGMSSLRGRLPKRAGAWGKWACAVCVSSWLLEKDFMLDGKATTVLTLQALIKPKWGGSVR